MRILSVPCKFSSRESFLQRATDVRFFDEIFWGRLTSLGNLSFLRGRGRIFLFQHFSLSPSLFLFSRWNTVTLSSASSETTWSHFLLGFPHVNMARTRKYVCFVYISHAIEKQQLLYLSQNKQKVHLHIHSLESHAQRWMKAPDFSLVGQWRTDVRKLCLFP